MMITMLHLIQFNIDTTCTNNVTLLSIFRLFIHRIRCLFGNTTWAIIYTTYVIHFSVMNGSLLNGLVLVWLAICIVAKQNTFGLTWLLVDEDKWTVARFDAPKGGKVGKWSQPSHHFRVKFPLKVLRWKLQNKPEPGWQQMFTHQFVNVVNTCKYISWCSGSL